MSVKHIHILSAEEDKLISMIILISIIGFLQPVCVYDQTLRAEMKSFIPVNEAQLPLLSK